MSIRQRKIAAALAAAGIVACFSACGGSTPAATTANNGINEAVQAVKDEMGEADFNEAANAVKEEPAKDTEAASATTVAPAGDDVVVPDASEFETQYDADLGGLIIKKYKGSAKRIKVPPEIDGDPVVKLGFANDKYGHSHGFSGSAQYVELPDSLTSVGVYAFKECGITEVKIPETVTIIESSAFWQCERLSHIDIPDSVTAIGTYAFYSCEGLEEITIPDSVTEISSDTYGANTFSNCTKLEKVTLSKGMVSIPAFMFINCSSLTEILIPQNIKTIEDSAFANCKKLRTLDIPDTVTSIGNKAFDGCDALTVTYKGEKYTKSNFDELYKLFK